MKKERNGRIVRNFTSKSVIKGLIRTNQDLVIAGTVENQTKMVLVSFIFFLFSVEFKYSVFYNDLTRQLSSRHGGL